MSDLTINSVQGNHSFDVGKPGSGEAAGGFHDIMDEALGQLTRIQSEADQAVKDVASGGDITQAIIAMQKVEMSFQFMVEMRNRLLSAYEEISRMQV
ncbi:MAG TPA: flagellar hook-basal body complex protein FliE [Dissulfurispiraceae bacterium]|nr:flagellar hook-basal body complex protein FliE [Dissulfurispiraceae bacterium]